ncbi:MAG: S8 family peptidase, partial [Bacteroidota bacterium]
QWSLERTRAKDWWGSNPTLDASKVIVAILDTGLDINPPEFTGRIVGAKNTFDPAQGSVVTDDSGHGTHCAGIIGATGNNPGANGMAGLAWDAKLMPVKVLGPQGGGDASILAGIDYVIQYNEDSAHTEKVRVINMSLGSSMYNQSLAYDDAFQYARSKGIVVCVAAGNDASEVASPSNNRYCLSVSSTSVYRVGTNSWEMLSGFSNRGERIDVAAPGGNIWSTIPGGYAYKSGTSMATPFVAGLAALVVAQQVNRGATPEEYAPRNAAFVDQVMQHLEGTSDDLGAPGKDVQFGWGRVNVKKAMETAFPAALP